MQKHQPIWNKIGAALQKQRLAPYFDRLKSIERCCQSYQVETWGNEEIKERFSSLKLAAGDGAALDSLLEEAFVLIRESVRRMLGIRLYDVQMIAAIALYEGKLIEMQTGEGKTLAAVLPACLYALQSKGVHILTFNDYLAGRDAEWMSPVYESLGLTAGVVREGMSIRERQAAYAADITYLTAKEAGFDYLKDSICYDRASLVQRPFHLAIIDEADSILIDEARVPLVIAGETAGEAKVDDVRKVTDIVKQLAFGIDYDTDEAKRNVFLTESGVDRAEAMLGCSNLYDEHHTDLLAALHCGLHAEALLKRDVDYIVRNGKVELIDAFTGRIAENRHWPDGIQAAVEAKEGLTPKAGGRVLGSITLQHLLSLYPRMSGMTGTAQASAEEFRTTYSLEVVVIPPHRPCRRIDHPLAVFTHREAKRRALVNEIVTVHQTGRPILVGTASVEESEELAADLAAAGISCNVLNAQNDEREAELIAGAGRWGVVTVSTNMAGRGVDIVLGGGEAEAYVEVAALGGLYVIGTNLHESSRVDHQLRGRAGRQGDPGASRFFISLEDELLSRFGLANVLPSEFLEKRQDEPLQASVIRKRIEHIQRVIEGQNFEIRKTLNKYSDLVEQQRRQLFGRRWNVLMDRERLTLLASRDRERYEELCRAFGEELLYQVEKQITLYAIDQCWADHLELISFIREGIHLESISNNNPLDEFHRQIIHAFNDLPHKLEQLIVDTFRTAYITEAGIDLNQDGLKLPSATWTYLVNDQFYSNRITLF